MQWTKHEDIRTAARFGLVVALLGAVVSGGLANAEDAVTVFRSEEPDGTVEFSDQNQVGSEPVIVETPMIQSSSGLKLPPPSQEEEEFSYSVLAITSPAVEATFRDQYADAITVSGKVSPGLRRGDRVFLTVDGVVSGNGARSPSFKTSRLERGTHSLQLEIRTDDGEIAIQSEIVTINVHRTLAVRKRPRN